MGVAYLWVEFGTWVGLIYGWSLACGLGLIMDWDDISEHFRHFRHSAVSPCPPAICLSFLCALNSTHFRVPIWQ